MGALERPVRHGGRERRAHLGVEVLPLRLEPLQRGQLALVRPGRVKRDEVEVQEVVGHRVEVLGVRVPGHELAEGDPLVDADVLDAELPALLPDRVRQLLVVEPPAALRRRVERIELEPGDLVLLHERVEPLLRLGEPLVGGEAAAQHDGSLGPALLDLRLLFDRDHVLAAVILPEAEGVEDGDAGVAPLQDQLAEVLDGHVLGAVREPHRLAQVVEELDEPHALLGRVDAGDVAVLPDADVRVLVDDEAGRRLPGHVEFVRGRRLQGLGLRHVEELHAGHLVDRQHGGREARGGAEEVAARQPGPGGVGVDVRGELLAQVAPEEQRRALRLRRHRPVGSPLESLEIFEDVELHARLPIRSR